MSDFAQGALQVLCLVFAVGCTTAAGTVSADAGVDAAGLTDLKADVRAADRGPADVERPADVPLPIDVADVPLPIDVADVVEVADAIDVADVVHAADAVDAADATDVVDAGRCDPAVGCRAFWCGCGRCDPSAITCVPEERGCPLDCLSSCPELETAACSCSGGSCGAPSFSVADAGTDAGGLAAGEPCSGDSLCVTGLLCCYPCGIPGCVNRCGAPDPRTGRCPLLP